MASLSLNPQERAAIDAFRRDVLEASRERLVLVRFTASWCGPCRQMAPAIEAVVRAMAPRVSEVVIDIDESPLIAEQFRIQSVPTVYAFVDGRPVDGFTGARSEREIRAFVERLAGQQADPGAELDALVAAASDALAAGDAATAAEAAAMLLRSHPDRADVVGLYAQALLALGQQEGARQALATVAEDSTEPAIRAARAALRLADEAAAATSGEAEFRARLADNAEDHDARFGLAQARIAAGDRDGAADALLAILERDRGWNEGAAKSKLLELIEAAGLQSPWGVAQRRRLSRLLFS